METFGFFNANNRDRAYGADDFALYMKKYFTDGVFAGDFEASYENMIFKLGEGDANIQGYRYKLSDSLDLRVSVGNSDYTRIDNVVLRLDLENRNIGAMIVEGLPSSSPVAPKPVRDSIIYDLVLYQITIPSGTSSLSRDLIKDTRFDSNLCGIVVGAVKQIDTTDVFAQYNAMLKEKLVELKNYFNNWFQELQTNLDGDIAANLEKQILELDSSTIHYEEIDDSNIVQLKDNQENNLYPKLDSSQIPTIPNIITKAFSSNASLYAKFSISPYRGCALIGATSTSNNETVGCLYLFYWDDANKNSGKKKIAGSSDSFDTIVNYSIDPDNHELTIQCKAYYTNGFIIAYTNDLN